MSKPATQQPQPLAREGRLLSLFQGKESVLDYLDGYPIEQDLYIYDVPTWWQRFHRPVLLIAVALVLIVWGLASPTDAQKALLMCAALAWSSVFSVWHIYGQRITAKLGIAEIWWPRLDLYLYEPAPSEMRQLGIVLGKNWPLYLAASGSATSADRVEFDGPWLRGGTVAGRGIRLYVEIPGGWDVEAFMTKLPRLASAMRVQRVEVLEQTYTHVVLLLVLFDPFNKSVPLRDHILGTAPAFPALEDGLHVGFDENDMLATVPLQDGHVAIQGMTRSGKSVLSYTLLSQATAGDFSEATPGAALQVIGADPSRLLLFSDARGVIDGTKPEAVREWCELLDGLIQERYTKLQASGRDKFDWRDEESPVLLVVLEEFPGTLASLADLDASVPKAEHVAPIFKRTVSRLLREGAKLNFRVVTIMQRFDTASMEGSLRAQFATRITMRVDNTDAVKMLHPEATPDQAANITNAAAGVGLIQTATERPRFFRAFLNDYESYRRQMLRHNASPEDENPYVFGLTEPSK